LKRKETKTVTKSRKRMKRKKYDKDI